MNDDILGKLRSVRARRLALARSIPTAKQLEVDLINDINDLLSELGKDELCFPVSEVYDYLCKNYISTRLRATGREHGISMRLFNSSPVGPFRPVQSIPNKICFRRIKK